MASRTVGAGKKVQLTVKTSGIDDGEAAEIQVFKKSDDSSLDTLSSKVKNKIISAEWTAKGPDPEGEEQSWEVYYKAKCKGLETKANTLVVYCDWVEVSSVDESDAALPDACFKLTAGQEVRERNTGSSGLRKEEYLPPGDVTIEWLPPYHLVEWVDEKGPKRKAKVKKVPPARLVWPPKGAHTQWVNLPADDAKPEQGSKLKLKVTLDGGKAGDKVYAKLAFGEENSKRNDPKPEFVGGTTAAWCPDGGIEAELSEDDGEVELELELGLAGGDVTVVSVGGLDTCADETLTITNWRKLYYQVTRPAQTKMPALDVLTAALDDVYIKYEPYAEVLLAEGDVPEGSLIDARELKVPGKGKRLVVGDHNLDPLKAKFQDDKTPIGAHVILCDAQYDGGPSGSWHEQTIEAEAEFAKKTIAIADNVLYDVFKTAIQNGQPALQSGSTWESLAPSGHADAGKSGELSAADLSFDLPGTPDKVQVVLPPDAAAVVANGNKVKLTLKLLVARGPFNGEATGKHQLIVRLPSDAATNGVLVHELGHAIKQALVEPAPGLSASDHGRSYTEKGHQGHHCANGLDDAQFAEADFMVHGEDLAKCVMWGAGSSSASTALNDGKFCEKCRPFVLAEACDVVDSDGGKQTVRREEVTAGDERGTRPTPTYRIALRLGDLDALCDPADTPAGRQQRAQVLGLFYEALGSSKWTHAWNHYRDVLASPRADEATAQQALVDGMGKEVLEVAGAADDAASALPGPTEFAKLRLPGGFTIRPGEHGALGESRAHRYRYEAEQRFYDGNWRIGAIPIIAKVEQQAAGSDEWSPAPDVRVHFQLIAPDALPEGNAVRAPALRTESRVRGGQFRGPAGYVERQVAAEAAVTGDPQVDNCPATRGGKRRPGAGQARDYFDLTDRPGFNARAGATPLTLAVESTHPLAVVAPTNADGDAGVIFRPSRQGGDRFKLRAFVDPIGETASDGTGDTAVKAETGTMVVWRNVRISKYLVFDYATSATQTDRAPGALPTLDFEQLRNDFENCYLELIVERTASRRVLHIGDSTWTAAMNHVRGSAARRPRYASMDLDRQAFFNSTSVTPGLLSIADPQTYDTNKGAGFQRPSSDSFTITTDWMAMVTEGHERFMEHLTNDGALSGITVVQAPWGDSFTAANTPSAELSKSGVATYRRGCYVFWGQTQYSSVRGPYGPLRNLLHELGHTLYLPHHWTDKYDKLSVGSVNGTFQDGSRANPEFIQGSTSGSQSQAQVARARYLLINLGDGRSFTRNEVVTGGTSSATATITRIDTGAVHGGTAGEHDPNDYCILSYQRNVNNDYDYCGKCNLKLRGWDTSAISSSG